MEELKKYISVQEYADFIGKTSQTVYNMIWNGLVPSVEFNRGTMKGRLVVKPEGYDEWLAKQTKTN